jgi:hypothetical protein
MGVWVGAARHHSYQTCDKVITISNQHTAAVGGRTFVSRTQRHMQTSMVAPACSEKNFGKKVSWATWKDAWVCIIAGKQKPE